ncbi:hypothetical protein [Myxococcus phage Mx1]|nr:hypothetical protein [Myxococcus phage Mx1]
MALPISDTQAAQLIGPIDADLEAAFLEGVAASAPVLDPLPSYSQLTMEQRATVRDVFRQVVAALVKRLNVQKPLPTPVAGTVTINYRKSDGITNGTMTFTDGILTGHT